MWPASQKELPTPGLEESNSIKPFFTQQTTYKYSQWVKAQVKVNFVFVFLFKGTRDNKKIGFHKGITFERW